MTNEPEFAPRIPVKAFRSLTCSLSYPTTASVASSAFMYPIAHTLAAVFGEEALAVVAGNRIDDARSRPPEHAR